MVGPVVFYLYIAFFTAILQESCGVRAASCGQTLARPGAVRGGLRGVGGFGHLSGGVRSGRQGGGGVGARIHRSAQRRFVPSVNGANSNGGHSIDRIAEIPFSSHIHRKSILKPLYNHLKSNGPIGSCFMPVLLYLIFI